MFIWTALFVALPICGFAAESDATRAVAWCEATVGIPGDVSPDEGRGQAKSGVEK